jgi:uncharacterized membrane protein
MIYSDAIWLNVKYMNPDDFLFPYSPTVVNRYLKTLGYKILHIGKSDNNGRTVIDGLTMYDFRHSSSCYWVSRYKNETALKYRFGWKKSDMIYYYTNFIGIRDTISEDDLVDNESKIRLERELDAQKQKNVMMEERIKIIEGQLNAMASKRKAKL